MEKIIFAMIGLECLLLLFFIYEWVCGKKSNSLLFLCIAYGVNAGLMLIPFFYRLAAGGEENWLLSLMDCLTAPFKAFVGEGRYQEAAEFAKIGRGYGLAYSLSILLALMATVHAAMQAFSSTLRNKLRLYFALRKKECDIVFGEGENALRYAKDGAAVLIASPSAEKAELLSLMEQGYILWKKSDFSALLESLAPKGGCSYNIICPGGSEENLSRLDRFIAMKKAGGAKKIRLFAEIEAERAKFIHRELIDKSGCAEAITTFCSNELLARKFTEEHPFTEYLPPALLEEGAIAQGAELQEIYLGFGALNREMYRQSVLNNQLASHQGGEYGLHPIHYSLFDEGIEADDWILDGLKRARMEHLRQVEDYYPLAPMPYETVIYELPPQKPRALELVAEAARKKNAFTRIIIDAGDTYCNIELGSRLRQLLGEEADYHLFIRSESSYVENDEKITYLEDIDEIFSHQIIVDDGLAEMARVLNEVYTAMESGAGRSEQEIRKIAAKSWKEMDHFTRYSNLYAALSLRLKLQLLGLDYKKEDCAPKGHNKALLQAHYPKSGKQPYEEYHKRSLYCALLAQEKYRWNAYHLLEGVMPMAKAELQTKAKDGTPPKKHACITTYAGLDAVICDLAAHRGCSVEEAECYQYDGLALSAAAALMDRLGYCLIERK